MIVMIIYDSNDNTWLDIDYYIHTYALTLIVMIIYDNNGLLIIHNAIQEKKNYGKRVHLNLT